MAGQKGNSGGKKGRSGRKSKAEEMGLQALLDKCWTPADREACIKTLAAQANEGDKEAVKLLMAYTFGKPVERKEKTVDAHYLLEYVNDWRSTPDNSPAVPPSGPTGDQKSSETL
jgi:hypothetical protein